MRRVVLCVVLLVGGLWVIQAGSGAPAAIATVPSLPSFPGGKPLVVRWLGDGRLIAIDDQSCANAGALTYRVWASPDAGTTWSNDFTVGPLPGVGQECPQQRVDAIVDGNTLYMTMLAPNGQLEFSSYSFPPANSASRAATPAPTPISTAPLTGALTRPAITRLDNGRLAVSGASAVAAGANYTLTSVTYESANLGQTWTPAPGCFAGVASNPTLDIRLVPIQGGLQQCVVYHYNASGVAVVETFKRTATAWDTAQPVCSSKNPTSAPVITARKNEPGSVSAVALTDSAGIWESEYRSGAWQGCRKVGAGKATAIARTDSWSNGQEVAIPSLIGPQSTQTVAVWRSSPSSSSVTNIEADRRLPTVVGENHDGWTHKLAPAGRTRDLVFRLSDSEGSESGGDLRTVANEVGVSNDPIRLAAAGQAVGMRTAAGNEAPVIASKVTVWVSANAPVRIRVGLKYGDIIDELPSEVWMEEQDDPVTHKPIAGAFFDVQAPISATPVELTGTLTVPARINGPYWGSGLPHLVVETLPKTTPTDAEASATQWVAVHPVRSLLPSEAPFPAVNKYESGQWTPDRFAVPRYVVTDATGNVIDQRVVYAGPPEKLSSKSILFQRFWVAPNSDGDPAVIDTLTIPIAGSPPVNYPMVARILDAAGNEQWRAPFEIKPGESVSRAYGPPVEFWEYGEKWLVIDSGGTGLSGYFSIATSASPTVQTSWDGDYGLYSATSAPGFVNRGRDLDPNTSQAVTFFDEDSVGEPPNDAMLLGGEAPFEQATLRIANPGDRPPLAWEYSAGATWKPLTIQPPAPPDDRMTSALKLDFTPPADWQPTAVDGRELYWVRSRPGASSPSAGLQIDQLLGARAPSGSSPEGPTTPPESRSGWLPTFIPRSDGAGTTYLIDAIPTSSLALASGGWERVSAYNTSTNGDPSTRPRLAARGDGSADVVGNTFPGYIGASAADGFKLTPQAFTLTPSSVAVSVKRSGTLDDHGSYPLADGLLFPSVSPGLDSYIRAAKEGIEEFSILRSDAAPSSMTWTVTDGSNGTPLAITANDSAVAVVRGDEIILELEDPWAMDITGAKVPVNLTVAGNALTIAVDTTSAKYPIVVDPGWGRYQREYPSSTGATPFKVRGYRMQDCMANGWNCISRNGNFRPEPTATSHALRALVKYYGFRNETANAWEVPFDLDWEVGDYAKIDDDSNEGPRCEYAPWRADIVAGTNRSYAPDVAEVKNYTNIGPDGSDVESQLNCYIHRFENRNVQAHKLPLLNRWVVSYAQTVDGKPDGEPVYENGEPVVWYAWARPFSGYPVPVGHIYFAKRADAPAIVIRRAHSTGTEKMSADLGYPVSGIKPPVGIIVKILG